MKYLLPLKKHPRKNLPVLISRKRGESNFIFSFAHAYYNEFSKRNSNGSLQIARELQVPGFGIADFVSILITPRKKTLHVFEMKMKDWRKAIAQAYRYKYYSNAVYVVLPPAEALRAKKSLSLFRTIDVGLWSFDKVVSRIEKIYNPKTAKPLSNVTHNKVLNLLAQQLNFP